MKFTLGAFALLLGLGCCATVPLAAQDNDHHDQQQAQQDQRHDQTDQDHRDADRDHDRDHANVGDRDDSSYAGNKHFEQGWKDGLKHKHKDHKWANDADRGAYEAGFRHGDHGEQWQAQRRDNDHDHDHDHDDHPHQP